MNKYLLLNDYARKLVSITQARCGNHLLLNETAEEDTRGGWRHRCMNTKWQCKPLEADGWEVVWIAEFISAIVGRFYRLIYPIILSVSVSPDLYEGQGWPRNPQCHPSFYGIGSYFELTICQEPRVLARTSNYNFVQISIQQVEVRNYTPTSPSCFFRTFYVDRSLKSAFWKRFPDSQKALIIYQYKSAWYGSTLQFLTNCGCWACDKKRKSLTNCNCERRTTYSSLPIRSVNKKLNKTAIIVKSVLQKMINGQNISN